ncbi:Helix-turn-helix [Rhizobiales bacterium GAS113]|nr:Helix-turn-helix [Rhizobiales bacterium GAS113]
MFDVSAMLFAMDDEAPFRPTFIRNWRKHRRLTLEQLGDLISMTASNLSMLERGQRGYSQETIEKIAAALQTDVPSLIGRRPGQFDVGLFFGRASADTRNAVEKILRPDNE